MMDVERQGMVCCTCKEKVGNAVHVQLLEDDTILVMCNCCYNKAEKFFNGGEKNGKPRLSHSRHK